jgi:hypothetical protein
MANPTSLPEPRCGATLPDGRDCPGTTAATITAEHPKTGSATVLWRCRDHLSAAVDTLARTCPDTVITATLLKSGVNPAPQPNPPAKPHLRVCK